MAQVTQERTACPVKGKGVHAVLLTGWGDLDRLSVVRSTQGVRWFYNAEESDGKVSEECTYLVGCFPHSRERIDHWRGH